MRRPAELFNDEKRVDFVKCDVEGYEIVIIPEMKELIRKFLPTMLIESRRESRKKIINLLTESGYSAFVLLNGKLINAITIPDNQDDILFVHTSHNHLVSEFILEKEGTLNLHLAGEV